MITSYLGRQGRLGNQLFQYAVSRAVADRNGYTLKIPAWKNGIMGKSAIQLAPFNLLAEEFMGAETITYEFHEPSNGFATYFPQVFLVPPNTALVGFFQSWKYFDTIADKIRAEFTMRSPYPELAERIIAEQRKTQQTLVGLHVRRGDYLMVNLTHRMPGAAYYQRAFEYFSDARYLIFSDDIGWCHEVFKGDQFSFIGSTDHWLDLAVFMRCDHYILAASSFSWWAAWLNQSHSKIVIAPDPWVGPALSHCPTEDLYPDGWIKLAG